VKNLYEDTKLLLDDSQIWTIAPYNKSSLLFSRFSKVSLLEAKMSNPRNRAVIYAATFGKQKNLINTIDVQIERCKAELLNPSYKFELVQVYTDEGGSSTDFNRPGLQLFLADARDGAMDWAFMIDYKRLSDKKENNLHLWNILKDYKVGVIIAPKPKKKDLITGLPGVRELVWTPSPFVQSWFDVVAGKKTLEEHEAEFGKLDKDDPSEQ
jgi:hypothetical protein